MVEKVNLYLLADIYHLMQKAGASMPEENKISKAQQKAVHKYVKNNYDRLEITVPKGQKAIIKAAAENAGESLNGYIKRAIDERMEREPNE